MSEIIQLYKDSNKTIKVYPKAIASEVYLDEENNIINKFDEINSSLDKKAYKSYVTYEEFGAKLNGVDDDTQAIINCHKYANENNLPVRQNKGIIFLKTADRIEVKTSLDLSGCDFLITEAMGNRILYQVKSSKEEIIQDIDRTQLVKGVTTIPFLANHISSFVTIESTERVALRNIDNPYYKKECLATTFYGHLVDGSLFFDYTNTEATLIVKKYPLFEKKLEIKCPNVIIKTTSDTQLARIFDVFRCNVDIDGLTLNIENMPYLADGNEGFKNALITCGGHNITVKNVQAINPSALDSGKVQSNYIIAWTLASNCYVEKCNLTEHHGATNSEYVKKLTYRDCTLNRLDNHFFMTDLDVNNCTFIGGTNAINVGYGDGIVNINNCRHISYKNYADIAEYGFVNLRPDLALTYSGQININNIRVDGSSDVYTFVKFINQFLFNNEPFETNIVYPKLNIDNVVINLPSTTQLRIIWTLIQGTYVNNYNYYFKDITMSNIRLGAGENASLFDGYIASPLDNMKNTFNFTFSNIRSNVTGVQQNDTRFLHFNKFKIDKITGDNSQIYDCYFQDCNVGTIDIKQKGRFYLNRCNVDTITLRDGVTDFTINSLSLLNMILNKHTVNNLPSQTSITNLVANDTILNTQYLSFITNKKLDRCNVFGDVGDNGILTECTITPNLDSSQSMTLFKGGSSIYQNCYLKCNNAKPLGLSLGVGTICNNCVLVDGTANTSGDITNLSKYVGSNYNKVKS